LEFETQLLLTRDQFNGAG